MVTVLAILITALAMVNYYGGLCAGITLWRKRGFDAAELLLWLFIPFYGLWLIRKYWLHDISR